MTVTISWLAVPSSMISVYGNDVGKPDVLATGIVVVLLVTPAVRVVATAVELKYLFCGIGVS